jgi:hypothetical protein
MTPEQIIAMVDKLFAILANNSFIAGVIPSIKGMADAALAQLLPQLIGDKLDAQGIVTKLFETLQNQATGHPTVVLTLKILEKAAISALPYVLAAVLGVGAEENEDPNKLPIRVTLDWEV